MMLRWKWSPTSIACRQTSHPSRLIRWEYTRESSRADYSYPRAHLHVNGSFFDGAPVGRLHIPQPSDCRGPRRRT